MIVQVSTNKLYIGEWSSQSGLSRDRQMLSARHYTERACTLQNNSLLLSWQTTFCVFVLFLTCAFEMRLY